MTNREGDAPDPILDAVTPAALVTLNMAVVFAPGDRYMLRHLYTVAGIGGILVLTGAAVTGRWFVVRTWPANKFNDGESKKAA